METIKNMPNDARVWVYQSNTKLSDKDTNKIIEIGNQFINNWTAHGSDLKASFEVFYNQFIVLAVDEQQAMASGCSIDKSATFVKELERQFNLILFDRLQVAYRDENHITVCHLSEFEKLAKQGKVDGSTIVFNNTIISKAGFDKEWEVALKDSWHKKVLV